MRATFSRCRCFLWLALLLGVWLKGGHSLQAQTSAPQNNAFNNALTITNSSGSANQFSQFPNGNFFNNFPGLYTFNATKQNGEPNHAGDGGGASAWFFWTPQHTGPALFTLRPAGFAGFNGTLLGAYTGLAVNALTPVGSNASFNTINTMSFPAVAGTTYAIAVDGATNFFSGTNTFTYGVEWSVTTNDHFTNATVLVGSLGIVTNDNTGATKELVLPPLEPQHDAVDPGGSSLWYRWTAPLDGPVTFTLNDYNFNFVNFVMAVYTGTDYSNLTLVTNTNGFSTLAVTFTATRGTTYSIAVDGAETFLGSGVAQTGPYTLRYAGAISTDAGHFTFNTRTQTVAESEASTYFTSGNGTSNSDEVRDILGAVVTITRTNATTGRMIVTYTTADISALAGDDYGTNGFTTPVTGSVAFDDFQMSTNFVIPIIYKTCIN